MGSVYTAEDYIALPVPDVQWVIKDFLPVGGQAVLYGVAKRGKSFLALQFAGGVASPEVREVVGFSILQHGPVVYLQLDTPRSEWHARLRNLNTLGVSLGQNSLYIADRDTPGVPYPFNMHRDWTWLQDEVQKVQPALVIIDTLRECYDGDENDSQALKTVFSLAHKAVSPAATLFLHHPKKLDEDAPPDLMNDMRGSGYVSGRVDGIMTITAGSTFIWQSRGSERQERQGKRGEFGEWKLDKHEQALTDAILAVCDIPCKTERERARLLAGRFGGMDEEKARSLLRRSGYKGRKLEES